MMYGRRHPIFTNRYASPRQGFVVIEIFLAVGIIVLLVTLFWIFIANARAQVRDSRREEDMKALKEALSAYAVGRTSYSPSGKSAGPKCLPDAGCAHLSSCGDQITSNSFLAIDLLKAKAIRSIPNDPLNPKYEPGPYNYYYASVGPKSMDYVISYCLETSSISTKHEGINQIRP